MLLSEHPPTHHLSLILHPSPPPPPNYPIYHPIALLLTTSSILQPDSLVFRQNHSILWIEIWLGALHNLAFRIF